MLLVDTLIAEEKIVKKEVRDEAIALHLLTKKTIENLSDVQVYELLELKWIKPLITALNKLPKGIIDNLTNKLQTMSEKYTTTLKNIEDEIKLTQKELSFMVDELTGDEFDMQGLKAFKELLELK